jgi:hypothetical protein
MQAMQNGYRGLSLLMDLNWDRMLYVCTIAIALAGSTWLGTIIAQTVH